MIGGSSPGRGWEFFSSPPPPNRLWNSHSLLSNGYREFFPWGKAAGVVKLTTHLHLVPMSRIHGAIPPLPQYDSVAWCSVKQKSTNYKAHEFSPSFCCFLSCRFCSCKQSSNILFTLPCLWKGFQNEKISCYRDFINALNK
jgi:hypothetical protein